jgi:hypothetical protein
MAGLQSHGCQHKKDQPAHSHLAADTRKTDIASTSQSFTSIHQACSASQYLTGYRTLCLPVRLYALLLTPINICYKKFMWLSLCATGADIPHHQNLNHFTLLCCYIKFSFNCDIILPPPELLLPWGSAKLNISFQFSLFPSDTSRGTILFKI